MSAAEPDHRYSPRGRRLPASTVGRTWREVAALALARIADDAGPDVLDRAAAEAALPAALEAAIAGTAASTDGGPRPHAYAPPPSPRLEWHDQDLLRGDALAGLAVEAAVLRAVGIGHDLSRDLRGPGRPDAVALLDAWLAGAMPTSDRALGFRSGDAMPGGDPAVRVVFPMWGGPGHGSRVVARFPVQAVDLRDAPVAARLRTPAGGLLDIRAFDGGFLRPVLSPGSWEPLSYGMFEAAVGQGRPWRDNPYVPAVPRGLPCMHLQDFAGREPPRRDWSPNRLSLEREAQRRAAWRAGLLFVMDDHVWRSCPEPFLTLGRHGDGGQGTWRLSWDIGNLRSTDDQSTWAYPHREPTLARSDPPGATRGAGRRKGAWGFRLGDLDRACALCRDHVSGLPGARALDPADVAVDVDPDLLAPALGTLPGAAAPPP